MLVLQVVRAKGAILAIPVAGHRALMVGTVLAGVKGPLAALSGCATLDTGCAPCPLAFKRWPGGASHLTEKDPSLVQRRIGATCPAELLVPIWHRMSDGAAPESACRVFATERIKH
jgi:hypothetical protein